jgi:2-polyprenyl-6-methoxyphenol hydroxylase-like FAD-dependent oxidoreductase
MAIILAALQGGKGQMSNGNEKYVAIVGGGIAGLTLGLLLHGRGIAFRIFERTSQLRPLGVGINVLPHAMRVLDGLGLTAALSARAVMTREAAFANRFGQIFYREPVGLAAGYAMPQLSIHRGDLQDVLVEALTTRAGGDCLVTDAACTGFDRDGDAVVLHFEGLPSSKAAMAVACDGIHSVIRKQMHPEEGDPKYSGYNMWRGVTRMKPFLTGATMLRAGWLATGKLVAYPIRDNVDGQGSQLVNWLAELETPIRKEVRDWNKPGRVKDFLHAYADWTFDWLDVPALFRNADLILDFPMVDQDPLPFWSAGPVTLMGDAAHPMYPRGSNGAGQAILDAECLANLLARDANAETALKAYEAERLDATARVVLANRIAPPDIILKEIVDRTGDKPYDNIDDVIAREELAAIQRRYREVAGYDLARLKKMTGG